MNIKTWLGYNTAVYLAYMCIQLYETDSVKENEHLCHTVCNFCVLTVQCMVTYTTWVAGFGSLRRAREGSMSLPLWAAVGYMFTCFVSGVPAAYISCSSPAADQNLSERVLSHRQGSLSAVSSLATFCGRPLVDLERGHIGCTGLVFLFVGFFFSSS